VQPSPNIPLFSLLRQVRYLTQHIRLRLRSICPNPTHEPWKGSSHRGCRF